MSHTKNDLYLPRRFERFAEEQFSHDASNKLLAQSPLTIEKNTAATASKRDVQENNRAFVPIKYSDLPRNANAIGSHTMIKQKDSGRVKARIVPKSHCDGARHKLQTDFTCLNLEISRLVLSNAAEQRRHIAQIDIAAAVLQARGFHCEVFVEPLQEEQDRSVQ